MANKRFEMYEYRNILARIRQRESDRVLAKAALIRWPKAKALWAVALAQSWLDPPVPTRYAFLSRALNKNIII